MATVTTNYGLHKPSYADNVDITVLNENADILDTTIKGLSNAVDGAVKKAEVVNVVNETTTGKVLDGRVGKTLADAIANCVKTGELVNNLNSTDAAKGLAASQGKALADLISARAKNPVDYTATLLSTGWSSSAPYTQTVTVNGMLSTDNPLVDIALSTTAATALNQLKSYDFLAARGKITTGTNSITAICYEDKPTVSLPLVLRVIRNG